MNKVNSFCPASRSAEAGSAHLEPGSDLYFLPLFRQYLNLISPVPNMQPRECQAYRSHLSSIRVIFLLVPSA